MWSLSLVVCFGTISSITGYQISTTHTPAINALIHKLQQENWRREETPCLEKTIEILENVKNFTLWATWVWNANAVPTGNLFGSWSQFGNYDQCMNPPWLSSHTELKTQYCLTSVILTNSPNKMLDINPYGSTEDFLNILKKTGIPINSVSWGLCVPAACRPHSITKIARVLYGSISYMTSSLNITVDHCQVSRAKEQYSLEFYLFLLLLATLLVVAVASTYYRSFITSDGLPPDSIETIVTKSFCIVKNHQALMTENKEEIKVMNGMRFMTAATIVSLHEILFSVIVGLANTREYEKDITGPMSKFLHLDVTVDTFFAMSGLLHIKGLLANPDRQKNLFMVLLKRYLRLIGPFALTIFFVTSVSKYTGSGPIWYKFSTLESEICKKTWSLSLLMLNSNVKYICHLVTWYLSCDYQLTVLGTVLFHIYQKNRRLGFSAFGTAAVFSLIIPGSFTYWYKLPATHFLDKRNVLLNLRNCWEINYTYTASYSRAGPYLVGIAMGYLMTVYRPADFRKCIPKTWSIIGTGLSVTVMLFILSLGKFFLDREYYPIETAIIAATNRVVWALAVCCIIGICEYGTVPLVSNFLGMSFFTPLSRLSYGIYIIHPLLIERNKLSTRTPLRFDIFLFLTDAIGTLVISTGISFVMWLLVEAPVINLSNYLLCTKSKVGAPTKVTERNGIQNQNGHSKTKVL